MPVFVEGMASSFCDDEYYPKREVSTPYPPEALPDVRVNKAEVPEHEARVLVKKYQRAVGMFMWASRHAFPESQLAASYASRVLSYPSLENWKAILHGIKWMHQHKDRGIKFTLAGTNTEPIVTVDASNKPDSMSLCQSGHIAFWYGGPVVWDSKRNAHADCAAPRNEYMAMLAVSSTVNWMRSLIIEAGFGQDSIDKPTHVYTDSKGAKEMASKDKITRSFKFSEPTFILFERWFVMGCVRCFTSGVFITLQTYSLKLINVNVFTVIMIKRDLNLFVDSNLSGWGAWIQIRQKNMDKIYHR